MENARKHGKGPLSTKQCIETLAKGVKRGIREVVITGGEPTLRNDLRKILSYCAKEGLFVHFQSNGRRFCDPKFAASLSDFDNVVYIIALHGATAPLHDLITRKKGSFRETVAGIRNLRRLGRRVVGKVVMIRLNQVELPELVERFSEMGVAQMNYAFPNISGGMVKRFDQLMPRYDDLRGVLQKVIAAANRRGVYVDFESVPYCMLPAHPELVWDAQYLIPMRRSVVHLDESPIDWDSARVEKKAKGSMCDQCVFDSICEGVWEEYLGVFGESELHPVSEITGDALARLLALMELLEQRDTTVARREGDSRRAERRR
jgi:MoaA/NifB/PqqE/SkfB family radical SAM enzyme